MSIDWEERTVEAVVDILNGIASSDFVTNAGSLAMEELRKYKEDMLVSVWSAWFGRSPTAEEMGAMKTILSIKLASGG